MKRVASLSSIACLACLACEPRAPAVPPVVTGASVTPVAEAPPSCENNDARPAPDADHLAGVNVALVCFAGNDRVKEDMLRTYARLQAGVPYDADAVAAAVERLFLSRELTDVQASVTSSAAGLVLTFTVTETPLLAQVRFEGLHAITEESLTSAFWSKTPLHYSARGFHDFVQHVTAGYAYRGYPYATATATTAPTASGVVVTIHVEEGPLVKVGTVGFEGAKIVRPAELGKLAATKAGDLYRAAFVEYDRARLEVEYFDRGMVLAKIGKPVVQPSADRSTMSVRFPISEGPVFHLSSLTFRGDAGTDERAFRAAMPVKVGSVFSRKKLVEGIEAINAIRKREGKEGAVVPDTEVDPARKTIALTLVLP